MSVTAIISTKRRIYSLERNKKISVAKKLHYSDSCKCACCKGRRGELSGKNNGMFGKTFRKELLRIKSKKWTGKGNPKYKKGYLITGKANPNYNNGHKIRGERNPNWRGGLSLKSYPDEWTSAYREQIRCRDAYVCQVCGCPETKANRKLSVHHIDYDKSNSRPDNLISLCVDCHIKTNTRRSFWEKLLKEKIYRA